MTDSVTHDRVLFPTDGSDCAEEAMKHAIDIAQRYDATLQVLTVVDTGVAASGVDVFSTYNAGALLDKLVDDGQKIVDDAVEAARNEGVASVEGTVLQGSPPYEILQYADEHESSLIVMGTHGRRGFRHALLGSVTEKVVRLASVPVFTVHADGVDATLD